MKLLKNFRNSALALSATSIAMMPVAHAAPDTNSILNAIINLVTDMAFWIGIILLVWAVVMLILALKNEDADSKSRAIMLIATSVALIGVGTLLKPILEAADFTFTES